MIHQVKNRITRPKLRIVDSPKHGIARLTEPIVKPRCYDGGNQFTFLNITDTFRNWNTDENGPLWSYNLNYMDWLEQDNISTEECTKWIDQFISELPNNQVGLAPYPIALRIINWAKFFSRHPECQNKQRNDSMYAQALLLEHKLEYHLLGNHLLEDSYALTIAAIYFNEEQMFRKASRLMLRQLNEQTLPDGAHYEQSPMYHSIMLDRLLDCINFSSNNTIFNHQETFNATIKEKASLLLGHLASIIYNDGTIPLLNDSANDIAPTAQQLFDYAKRLGITWNALPLNDCGYRKLGDKHFEVIADIGNIAASYQPGHSHADTFSYELRIDGQPIIVDTGISTYNKNNRRQYERSTSAHNTVSVDDKNSSQVWGGFRIGRRAKVTILKDEPNDIIAFHDGFGRKAIHERHFYFKDSILNIEDTIIGDDVEAVSHLHFNPNFQTIITSEREGTVIIGNIRIKVDNFHHIALKKNFASTEYNRLKPCYELELHFRRKLKYSVRANK